MLRRLKPSEPDVARRRERFRALYFRRVAAYRPIRSRASRARAFGPRFGASGFHSIQSLRIPLDGNSEPKDRRSCTARLPQPICLCGRAPISVLAAITAGLLCVIRADAEMDT